MPFNTKSHRESLNMPVCACQLAVLSLHRFANLEIIAIDCSDPDAVLWEEVRLAHTRTTRIQHDSMCSAQTGSHHKSHLLVGERSHGRAHVATATMSSNAWYDLGSRDLEAHHLNVVRDDLCGHGLERSIQICVRTYHGSTQ